MPGLFALRRSQIVVRQRTLASSEPDAAWRLGLSTLVRLGPLALGLLAWGMAVHTLDHVSLEIQSVPGVLPATWWIGLAVLLYGSVVASCSSRPRPWLVAAYVAALALVLFGTLPAVLDAPQYQWTYKHIGVVQLFEQRGTVTPSVDIYNRWPGFFSAAAALSQLMGLRNPVAYAAWAELFFAWINALLIAALVWSLLRDARIAGLATVLFTVGNWIGQGSFAPQATAFPLSLAVLLLTLRHFGSGGGGRRVIRLVELVVRRRQAPNGRALGVAGAREARASSSRLVAAAVIVLLDAAIVATHQLTPYILLLQLGGLAVLGILRPRWILVAMAAVTIGYLLPNLRFVAHNYGLFTSLDPFVNGQAAATTTRPVFEPWIDLHAGQLLSLLFLAGAGVASLLLARRGLARRALPLVVLAVMPVGLLFGQAYGGEAALRVFLFSGPWCAALIAWAIVDRTGTRTRQIVAIAAGTVVAALFVPAFFGPTWVNVIPADEVAASSYFYDHAPAGSVLVGDTGNFPIRVGARYAVMARSSSDPNLIDDAGFRGKQLGAQDVGATMDLIRSHSDRGFIVFSTSGYRYAQVDALTPPGALANLERAIAESPFFELWHQTPNARIYRLLDARSVRHLSPTSSAPRSRTESPVRSSRAFWRQALLARS